MLSIVVPCYNEEIVLNQFFNRLTKELEVITEEYEIVFINDGSTDKTINIIKSLSLIEERVRYISFSRNFGKEAAMLAGLRFSNGDAVLLMDADLQHPPEIIHELIHHYCRGYDQVIAKRTRKGEKRIRTLASSLYYKIMNKFIDIELIDGVGDFRLLSKRAISAVLSLGEYNRFSKGLFSWIGFKEYVIEYENIVRRSGTSKWNFNKLLNYGIDGVISFNNKPLRLSIYIGLIITILGIIYVIASFFQILTSGVDVPGYFTTITSVLILGGIQLIFLGIIGEYIGRIYYESKRRPHYIIEEQNIMQYRRENNQDIKFMVNNI